MKRRETAGVVCLLLAAALAAAGEPGEFKRRRPGRGHYMLRLGRPLEAVDVQRLARRGVRVLNRVSADAVLVSAPDDAVAAGLALEPPGAAAKLSAAASETDRAWVAAFHADVAGEDARAVVREAGLDLLEHEGLLARQLLVSGTWERVAALAEWDEVAYIFPAAEDLLLGSPVVACPGALTEYGPAAPYTSVGRGWSGAGEGTAEIGYFFASMTSKLPRSTVESEVVRALQEWAKYGNLDFFPGASAAAHRTITVLFASRAHGDAAPFDGPGKVLAHTYYPAPPNPEPIAGDMHLDEDENWQAGAGIDLFTVALHEAGHALGLGHSDRPGSVMYPYYRRAAGLAEDDIAGIRALYGAREAAAGVRLWIREPAAASVSTAAASISLSGTAENALSVAWRSDRGPSGTAQGVESWTVPAAALSPGRNVITVTAAGASGAQAVRSVTVTRVDAGGGNAGGGGNTGGNRGTPPAMRITSPAFTIVSTSQGAITLRGTASSAAGIASVTWSNAAGGSGTAQGTTNWVAADIPLFQGTNSITVRAYDTAGNSSWRALAVVRR